MDFVTSSIVIGIAEPILLSW